MFGYVLRTMFSEQAYPVECGNSLYFVKSIDIDEESIAFDILRSPKVSTFD